MAKAITDEKALRLARKHIKPDEVWRSENHCMLLWDYFREAGFLKDAKPEEIAKAAKEWVAFYNNARCAYASNQAKGFADAGVCKASASAEISGEFK